ncbi:protein of unknown function DUF456 [Cellulomonas flavigena DSM 20109]|uniref:DUF456 domain-containing protein n=1 Tax=Cellulomonas flavigena (strain ATCC 482 / DSM 20109 / BCRC 11376 / JCM 18109 / NBRC 3775 / NCIMB 8073 / NRS 134) TaxID=446466 RepID=D5UI83_CELFN|nr:DUF456 domain-containing protein [Cellulomonas flavigena]ADG75428.1 protein of unknown function DUF456 [Cellulomonas flavigena DSM 20109]
MTIDWAGELDLLVTLLVVVGLVGVVVQVLPGAFLVGGAVAVWGGLQGTGAGWVVTVLAVLLTVAGQVVKYLVAGRHLQRSGVRNSTLVWGGVAGIVGFFVVPVVGLPLFFVGAVLLVEWLRARELRPAWQATVRALQATGLTILVELAAAMLVVGVWVVALVAR